MKTYENEMFKLWALGILNAYMKWPTKHYQSIHEDDELTKHYVLLQTNNGIWCFYLDTFYL